MVVSEMWSITLYVVMRSHCSRTKQETVEEGGAYCRITIVNCPSASQFSTSHIPTNHQPSSLGFNVPCAYPITHGIFAV
ncbi:hypothetical protein HKD37_13G036573 [Glycine soja]